MIAGHSQEFFLCCETHIKNFGFECSDFWVRVIHHAAGDSQVEKLGWDN